MFSSDLFTENLRSEENLDGFLPSSFLWMGDDKKSKSKIFKEARILKHLQIKGENCLNTSK